MVAIRRDGRPGKAGTATAVRVWNRHRSCWTATAVLDCPCSLGTLQFGLKRKTPTGFAGSAFFLVVDLTATAVAVPQPPKNADPAKPVGVFHSDPNRRVPQPQGQSRTAVAVHQLQWQFQTRTAVAVQNRSRVYSVPLYQNAPIKTTYWRIVERSLQIASFQSCCPSVAPAGGRPNQRGVRAL